MGSIVQQGHSCERPGRRRTSRQPRLRVDGRARLVCRGRRVCVDCRSRDRRRYDRRMRCRGHDRCPSQALPASGRRSGCGHAFTAHAERCTRRGGRGWHRAAERHQQHGCGKTRGVGRVRHVLRHPSDAWVLLRSRNEVRRVDLHACRGVEIDRHASAPSRALLQSCTFAAGRGRVVRPRYGCSTCIQSTSLWL